MTASKALSRFPNTANDPLHRLTAELYASQARSWPMLSDGVAALQHVQFRTVDCGDFSVRLQCNPKRIVSTGAKVDAATIKERKCFLCVGNLPPEQQGVLYKDSFLVLCNPMPIFPEHFTISHVDHIPQSIEERILTFLQLAKELSPVYSVFYNGPKCGASAPDHLHFQASPTGAIPAEKEYAAHRHSVRTLGGLSVATMERYGRSVIVLEGTSEQETELGFLRLTSVMRRVLQTNEEPMMNVIGSYDNGTWRLMVFLRGKHRPAAYFREGEEQVLISPASVDIGGLIVTPKERDFQRTDAALITSIFREVSVADDLVHTILQSL